MPVVRPSLALFAAHPEIDCVQAVIHFDDCERFGAAAEGLDIRPPVFGGATRQASVRAGLDALVVREPDIVLIHDAARPFISAALVTRVIAALKNGAAFRRSR